MALLAAGGSAVLVFTAIATGTATATAATTAATTSSSSTAASEVLTVSAAASLTGAFRELAADFRRRHPGTVVRLNLGASSSLLRQIQAGAPVDVFAAADRTSIEALRSSGHLRSQPLPLARNRLQIAVKPGNPLRLRGLADLGRAPVLALCGATAPCGRYAATALQRAGVRLERSRLSRGTDARATLLAVSRGDADAAIVYATDVRAAGRAVQGVEIAAAQNISAWYGLAIVRAGGARPIDRAFVDHATSARGQAILRRHGFAAP
ncbi:molybdate ABC transporter substrate-binding protein [Synechococcus sp. ATX 2A4]|uniref:molybdate ABC transporter substrate-binding protein n=1 Tax=Synechococcus sp. ATX 2A4 TaxID=2823727 RepID=UPI0020CF5756|nr:molybdate ABC transporter substrate-binding protein [Synechococcus sp. ATX 2A4]MCP9886171.1 molybdate ABC transporter substrate-binding protein [Synechococcus sp. ATX 2A4]